MNDNNKAETAANDEKFAELVKAVNHNGIVSLKTYFEEVEGRVLNQDMYGPVFIYSVKDESNDVYACGFFLRELIAKFQSGGDVAEWMASFYFELMKNKGGAPLPKSPGSEDEAKAFIDKTLVPHCIQAVQEEFAPRASSCGARFERQDADRFRNGPSGDQGRQQRVRVSAPYAVYAYVAEPGSGGAAASRAVQNTRRTRFGITLKWGNDMSREQKIRIERADYRGLPSIEMESASMKLIIVPDQGGSIVSLRHKAGDKEWIVDSPLSAHRQLGYGDTYTEEAIYGWDECYPTIVECAYPENGPFEGK